MLPTAEGVTANGTTREVVEEDVAEEAEAADIREKAKVMARMERNLAAKEAKAAKDRADPRDDLGRGAGAEAMAVMDITEDLIAVPPVIRIKMAMLLVVVPRPVGSYAGTSVVTEAATDHVPRTARARLESRTVKMDLVGHHVHATAGVAHHVHEAGTLSQSLLQEKIKIRLPIILYQKI